MHVDRIEGQEEQRAAERRIEQERHEVDGGEHARAEQHQRQHRRRAACLDPDESQQQQRAPASVPITAGWRQPRSDEAIKPKTRLPKPARVSSAPRQSSIAGACGSRLSGTWRRAIQAVRTPIGRLMKKMARHDRASTSHPPRIRPDCRCDGGEGGPRSDGAAALLRLEGGADDRQRAGDEQRPAQALNGACHDELGDIGREPHQIDATVKMMMPAMKMRRRPKRSRAAPPISRHAERNSV